MEKEYSELQLNKADGRSRVLETILVRSFSKCYRLDDAEVIQEGRKPSWCPQSSQFSRELIINLTMDLLIFPTLFSILRASQCIFHVVKHEIAKVMVKIV